MTNLHVCRFTAGLDELTRKQQRDPKTVLETLKRIGRFSTWEATENSGIAKTVTLLEERGLIEHITQSYPWIGCRVTEAGEKFLLDGEMPPEKDPFEDFVRVGRNTYVAKSIAANKGLTEWKESE